MFKPTYYTSYLIAQFILSTIQTAFSMSLLTKEKTGQDVAKYIFSKGYLPSEKNLPTPVIIKNVDNDVSYLLSKLSDEELIKLLSEQPNKNEYNVQDLVKLTTNTKYTSYIPNFDSEQNSKTKSFSNVNNLFDNLKKKRFETVSHKNRPQPQGAYFRLEQKEVDPFATNKGDENQNAAVQKIHNLFYNRPVETEDDDEKKELLFDVLVAQLKTLCCKRNKQKIKKEGPQLKLKSLLHDIIPKEITSESYTPEVGINGMPKEHMFLILNDEIKSNGNEAIISVDPESLGKNSTVMLLGPVLTPLSDAQLKVVMMRISNELSKPEYHPLLQQISDGTLSNEHIGLMDSLVTGPQTRRYIKPHRCNHQSQLTRVYGGPKWIICTGYLNLNTPSLYD